MNVSNLYSFLKDQTPEEHHQFIYNELKAIVGDSWGRGYMTCVRHNKKRKSIVYRRRSESIKHFLDFISDLTHN